MNRINMLRFRPIAPKPTSGDVFSTAAEQAGRNGLVKNGRRAKRKYVRARRRQSKRKTREGGKSSPPEKSGVEEDSSLEKGVVTLQLLPERSESDKSCDNSTSKKIKENWNIDPYKAEDDVMNKKVDSSSGGLGTVELGSVRSVIDSWIIVERVTDTFIDTGVGLGLSDREKINNLQVDTCPGFVSDGTNNVIWVNEAYRKMEAAGENGVMVWLVVKDKLPQFCPSFACRVKLIQHTKHGHKWNKIVPCDVWRMEFAGFAWKLDVNTALGLGI